MAKSAIFGPIAKRAIFGLMAKSVIFGPIANRAIFGLMAKSVFFGPIANRAIFGLMAKSAILPLLRRCGDHLRWRQKRVSGEFQIRGTERRQLIFLFPARRKVTTRLVIL
jgi:hypothetical protein